jgi:hypothetical protein
MLCHRTFDLSKSALELYKINRFIPAAVLIRSAQESSALLYYVAKEVKLCLDKKQAKEIHTFLENPMLGSKFEWDKYSKYTKGIKPKKQVKAIQILNAIDSVNKIRPDFRMLYDTLCEYAHPNQQGVWNSYAKQSGMRMRFDSSFFSIENRDHILSALFISLLAAITSYHEINSWIVELTALCEADIANNTK